MLYREVHNSIFDVYDRILQNTDRPLLETKDCPLYRTDKLSYADSLKILSKGNKPPEQMRFELQQKIYDFEESMNIGTTFSGPLHDVAGFTPDVPEHLVGSPIPMLNLGDEGGLGLAAKPIVKIGICTSLACTCGSYGCRVSEISPNVFYNRGAAIVSLIDYLESMGQRCEVWSLFRGDYNSYWGWDESPSWEKEHPEYDEFSFEIKLKNASDPWNPSTVTFPLLSSAWIRRINFRLLEIPEELKPYTDRVGEVGNRYYGALNYGKVQADLDDWDIYFAPLSYYEDNNSDCESHYRSEEKAIKHIQDLSQGVIPDDLRMEM